MRTMPVSELERLAREIRQENFDVGLAAHFLPDSDEIDSIDTVYFDPEETPPSAPRPAPDMPDRPGVAPIRRSN